MLLSLINGGPYFICKQNLSGFLNGIFTYTKETIYQEKRKKALWPVCILRLRVDVIKCVSVSCPSFCV